MTLSGVEHWQVMVIKKTLILIKEAFYIKDYEVYPKFWQALARKHECHCAAISCEIKNSD
jgi:hypothetical protein